MRASWRVFHPRETRDGNPLWAQKPAVLLLLLNDLCRCRVPVISSPQSTRLSLPSAERWTRYSPKRPWGPTENISKSLLIVHG